MRVAVITGSSEKAFCAGADITEMTFDPEKARAFLIQALEVLQAPERARKPVRAVWMSSMPLASSKPP